MFLRYYNGLCGWQQFLPTLLALVGDNLCLMGSRHLLHASPDNGSSIQPYIQNGNVRRYLADKRGNFVCRSPM